MPRKQTLLLLLDIGNTHTHVGLALGPRMLRTTEFATVAWRTATALERLRSFIRSGAPQGAALCSVVPGATRSARRSLRQLLPEQPCLELTAASAGACLPLEYPEPATVGPDRLANAIAARHHYGAPCLSIDFGTAVTFDVVNKRGCFVGGAIAPGLALFATYLGEKTALLPRIEVVPTQRAIGRSTVEAMQAAAFLGFRGLVGGLTESIRAELRCRNLPVVATGGYARLVATGFDLIGAVHPHLTLEGLRLAWECHHGVPPDTSSPASNQP